MNSDELELLKTIRQMIETGANILILQGNHGEIVVAGLLICVPQDDYYPVATYSLSQPEKA